MSRIKQLHHLCGFRTYSVFPAEIIYGAYIRTLDLFKRSLVLDQQSGTGSSVPEKYTSKHNVCVLILLIPSWKIVVYKLKYDSLIGCDTVLDISLLQSLKGLDDSKQLCHVIIP